jgi:tetratricopeptide (TPR) repeat protein/predicted Ser/Thr protein kinase
MSELLNEALPEIPGYVRQRKIGEGGMGVVYLAQQRDSGARVAIKYLRPSVLQMMPHGRMRFEREARLVSKLSHPNVVSILSQGCVGGVDYLLMEYVEGHSLRQRLDSGKPMDVSEVQPILQGLFEALIYVHEIEIVHRDLKPENVLLDSKGNVKVTDFGIAAQVQEIGRYTETGTILGSADYVAPEQRSHAPLDQRADQFSLAVIAYEMLTGKRPLGRFKTPSELNPKLSRRVDRVLLKALQEDPEDRYLTVREFEEEMTDALSFAGSSKLSIAAFATAGVAVLAMAALWFSHWVSRGGPDGSPFSRRMPAVARTPAVRLPDGPATSPDRTQVARLDGDWDYFGSQSNLVITTPGITEGQGVQSKNVTRLIELGDKAANGRWNEKAISYYTDALRGAPRDPVLYFKRGDCYRRKGMYRQTLADLDMALQLNPNYSEARAIRGAVYFRMNDFSKALTEVQMALKLDPNDPVAYTQRGRIERALGKDEQARSDFDRGVELGPNRPGSHYYRGFFRQETGDLSGAVADYREAIRINPANPIYYPPVAWILATAPDANVRNKEDAMRFAVRGCEMTGWESFLAVRSYAAACAANGNREAAVEWGEKALALAPDGDRKVAQAQLDVYRKKLGEASPVAVQVLP